jgi:hypothetical protein
MYGEVVMKNITTKAFLIIVSISFCWAHEKGESHYVYLQNPNDLINPQNFYEYRIIRNDHLSHLAYKFYRDGIKWPKIYKANPYVVDPNWIYPDNWLVIPDIFTDKNGKPITKERSFIYKSDEDVINQSNYDKAKDGENIDKMVSTSFVGIDTENDGHIDGYDIDGDGVIDAKSNLGHASTTATQIDLDGDGIFDGVDINGDGIIDSNVGIDLNGDGIVDGFDIDNDGTIDVESGSSIAFSQIDLDGDGIFDGVDIDGDGIIDPETGIDFDGDGIIDGYDTDGDGYIDVKAAGALAVASQTEMFDNQKELIAKSDNQNLNKIDDYDTEPSYSKSNLSDRDSQITEYSDNDHKSPYQHSNPNWIIGLHGGYPFGDVPAEDDNLNFCLLVGTPLRIVLGPLSARVGGGILGYDFNDKLYPGVGLLLNLAISELLKLSTPVQLQVHGTGFYVPEGSIGKGVIGSVSVPLGDSSFNLGLYVGMGEYDNSNSIKSDWKNAGLMLQLQL